MLVVVVVVVVESERSTMCGRTLMASGGIYNCYYSCDERFSGEMAQKVFWVVFAYTFCTTACMSARNVHSQLY